MDSRQKAILLITSLGSFLTPFMGSSINIAIPSIGAEFSTDTLLLSWVVTSYLLTSAIFIVPMGRLADMRGRRKIFLTGILIYTTGSLLCTMVPSVEVLIAFRVLQGIGASLIFATAIAIVTSAMPPKFRGAALGINVAFTYAGLTLGPFLGGLITEFMGWRSIFYANVVIGVLVLAAGLKYLRFDEIKDESATFDFGGSFLYALTILFFMLGFQELPDPLGFGLFALSILTFSAFFMKEKKEEYPVFNISLITGNRVFALSNIAAFINYSATYAITYLLSIYLQTVRGFDPFFSGMILIAQPIIQTVLSPVTGKLSDRYSASLLATAGMALITVGLFLFSNLDPGTSIAFVVVNLVLLGLGYALFSSPNTHIVMDSVDERKYGVASGILGTMRLCGMMSSMGISMLAFSLMTGRQVLADIDLSSLMSAINIAFTIFVALCAVGTVASYLSKTKKKSG